MADDSFGSNRSRDLRARNEASDPLAELARLIGQGDPYAEGRTRNPGQDDASDPGLEWGADHDYADEGPGHYAPPPLPAYMPPERDYPPEPPPVGKFFSGRAAKFNGFGDERDADDAKPAPSTRQLPAFLSAPVDEPYEGDTYAQEEAFRPQYETDPPYQADDYYDEQQSPRRNTGLIVVMALLGLAVIGTAGAFAYRAMFGGPIFFGSSVFAGLPPIIKAPTSPIRVVPNNNAQADNAAPAAAAGGSSTEKLVPREEQPMEPPKPAPRVIPTIPVVGGQAALPTLQSTSQANSAPLSASAPPAMTAEAPMPPAPQAPIAAPAAPPASPQAAPASPEPKKVRTVTIRANQPNNAADASAQPAATPAAPPRNAARPVSPAPKASAPPAGANAPLSIIPGSENEVAVPAPVRTRTPVAASAPVALASAEPTNNGEPTNTVASGAATASAGGYAVQVTSQHSEADAQASFKALQSKFPTQLGSRQAIIRRADLGAKGVYYRALVGPFGSADEAAGLCSSLKAAGGNCIVQRN